MRKRVCVLSWGLSLSCLLAGMACFAADTAPVKVKRILIVGDSWAASIATTHHDPFPPGFGTMDTVLRENKLEGYESLGGATAWGGRKASDWVKPENLELITKQLKENPTIDIVHLIIGGNDFLSQATKGTNIMSLKEEERAVLWDKVKGDIQTTVNHCLAQRPDIRVVIADYDYLDTGKAQSLLPKFDFGGATAKETNSALLELGRKKLEIAKNTPRCFYVSNWGRLQCHYKSPKENLPLPGSPPGYEPFAGGDPESPMPPKASVGDGIHPTDEAHRVLLQACVEQLYREWLTKSGAQPIAAASAAIAAGK